MKRSTKIFVGLILLVLISAQAVGLFLLVRPAPVSALTLSETSITLMMDEGRRVPHTVEPASASAKLLHYKVSASDPVVAWIDDKNEMLVALSPGTCTVTAEVDGQTAKVEVTVLSESILCGTWTAENGDTLTIDGTLLCTLETAGKPVTYALARDGFTPGENSNPYRYVKLTGTGLTLYYDRLLNTVRLHPADGDADRMFAKN